MDPSGRKLVRRRVVYHGRVQGVGFRYTTAAIAKRFPVAGYVKNLPDGTVELVAQAEPVSLQGFLNEIAQHFQSNITEAASCDYDSTEEMHGFDIRF